MGVGGFGLLSLVCGFGFLILRSWCLVCSLQSHVEVHTDVSAQFGALPPLRTCPNRVSLVRSAESCARQ